MRLRLLSLLILFSGILFSCTGQQSSTSSYKNVSVEQASKLMQEKKDIIVLDVRTRGEVAEGIIEGAKIIDFQSATFTATLDQLNKEQPVLVYCAVGGRSGKTMEMMKAKGFKEVYNLEGGINAWKAAGKPLVK